MGRVGRRWGHPVAAAERAVEVRQGGETGIRGDRADRPVGEASVGQPPVDEVQAPVEDERAVGLRLVTPGGVRAFADRYRPLVAEP
jgi:hypothetical protein